MHEQDFPGSWRENGGFVYPPLKLKSQLYDFDNKLGLMTGRQSWEERSNEHE